MPHHTTCATAFALLASCVVALPAMGQQASPVRTAIDEPHEDHIVPCDLSFQFDDRSVWNANLWPGGTVPYEVDANVTAANATRLRQAMNELETYANVRFIPRTNQSAYVHVQDSTGNNSSVGRTGGAQIVNLYNWSYRYIICHELMHALGVWHEQQRPDRGTYVSIVTANIQSGYAGNFSVRSTASVVGPFDFESIMLYDDCSFSTCCPAGSTCGCAVSCATILAQPAYSQYQNSMGNRNYLSDGDKLGLATRYRAPVDDIYEDNDTLATAHDVWTGPSADLRLLDTDDYFRIHIGGMQLLTVTATSGVWAASNMSIYVLNSGGTVLRSAAPADPDGDGVYTATISFAVPAGNYYIHANRLSTWGGDYSLTVSPACDAIDFNADGLFPDSGDIDDFLSVFSGGPCSNGASCHDIDFNNDGLSPDTTDIDAFLSVFSGGACLL